MFRMPLITAMVATLAGSAIADGLDDLEIAHTAYTAGQIDIRYAHLALAISENADVHEFARTMLRDHQAVNDAAGELLAELGVSPKPNAVSDQLNQQASQIRATLRAMDGEDFDCTYAKNELAYHQFVNNAVEQQFIPTATVPELKELLSDALVTFKAHESHAGHMVAALSCG